VTPSGLAARQEHDWLLASCNAHDGRPSDIGGDAEARLGDGVVQSPGGLGVGSTT